MKQNTQKYLQKLHPGVPAQRRRNVPVRHSELAECWKMQSHQGHDPKLSPTGAHNAARTQTIHYSSH